AALRPAQGVGGPPPNPRAGGRPPAPPLGPPRRLLRRAGPEEAAREPRAAAVQARLELRKKTVALPSAFVGHVRSRYGEGGAGNRGRKLYGRLLAMGESRAMSTGCENARRSP